MYRSAEKGGRTMARTDANINKETLSFICSQIGITIAYLSQRTGQTEERVGAWLDTSNTDYPTINQAKGLAKVLKVPFAGLYMNKDILPVKQLPTLRNLRTLPYEIAMDDSSLNLAVVELIRYHDFLTSSESEMDIKAVPLSLPSIADNASVSEYAKTIREFFDIKLDDQFKLTSPRQFYLYVRQKIESKGIFVHCFTGVDVETARGISIFDDTAPIIGVNDDDRYPAKTFSIIHELVHILKRQSTLCNEMVAAFSSTAEEVFCNAVAGEVLVPAASLNAYLNAKNITAISLVDIETMASRFSISKEVVVRRLLDTSRFTQDEYDTFANEIRQNFLQQKEADKLARQEGRGQQIPKNVSREAVDKTSPTICRILLIGYSDGYFSKQEVSGFLGIKEKHIPKFLAEVAKW
jgi:Zn-dependent peptidase ImmA (M78 family)